MENKIITIYELMGLIEDGKAPYEIIYKNSKYFIDELEGYYKRKDGTPLFEHIFDNYNDYEALQEKVTIPEENDEWEDIEEINIENDGYNDFIKNEHGTKCGLTKHSKIIAEKVNQLIKNQRKIIEKLEDKNE